MTCTSDESSHDDDNNIIIIIIIITSNHLVLMNGKLQDIIWHPVNTGLIPGTQTIDKTNPTKNGLQRKTGSQKE